MNENRDGATAVLFRAMDPSTAPADLRDRNPSPLPFSRKPGNRRPRRSRHGLKAATRKILKKIFRKMFWKDGWFLVAVVAFVLLLALLVLLLPKIWRVTPDRLATLRVSGLDLLQARSLRRAAARAAERGDFPTAVGAWEAALANNPADQDALRGALRTLLNRPDAGPAWAAGTARHAAWLLALSATNRADLNLVVTALGKVEADEYAIALADAKAAELDPPAFAALAAAAFRRSRLDRYGALWDLRRDELGRNPEAVLIHAAWESGWGPASTRLEGRRSLEAAVAGGDAALATLARRLRLRVSALELDVDAFERDLHWLQEHHADRVGEQVGLWRLLTATGRRDEAAALAKSFSRPPQTAGELVAMADAMAQLGLTTEAANRLQGETKRLGDAPGVWTSLARMDVKLQRWAELRDLAAAMREVGALRGQLDGYSRFLTGLADHAMKFDAAAEQSFRAAAASRSWEPALAFESATAMRNLGFPGLAADLLRGVEGSFANRAEFWFELGMASYSARDLPGFAEASAKAYELAPRRAGVANNYAAALLLTRSRPEKAIELTLELYNTDRTNPDLAINYALALIQNGRLDDAATLLRSIEPGGLRAAESSSLHLAWAAYHLGRKAPAPARAEFAQATDAFVFPAQKQWFNDEIRKIEASPAQP